MKKQIGYVILGTMLGMGATMALNLNMDISNLVAYFKQIVLTDNGTSSGTPTITFNGNDGKIQGAGMDIDVKNGSIAGSKVNIDLKNGNMHIGGTDLAHKVVIKSELDNAKSILETTINNTKSDLQGQIDTTKNDINDIKNNYATKSYVDSKATNRFNKIYLNGKCYVSDSNSVSCNNADMVGCEDLKNHQICTYESNKPYDLDAGAASSFSSYLKDTRRTSNELYNYWLTSHSNYIGCTLSYARVGDTGRRPWIWKRNGSGKIRAGRYGHDCNTSSANCSKRRKIRKWHIHFVVGCPTFYWK